MEDPKTALRLTDPETAQPIVDDGAQRFLRPFLSRECTAKAAADKLGVSLSLMSYWLKRFQDAGLLKVVRLEPRRGRPVKVYRSTADVFIAPFELLPSATLMEFFVSFGEEQQRFFTRALGRVAETWLASDWAVSIQLNEDGKVRTDATPDPARTDVVPDFLAQDAPAAWQSFSTAPHLRRGQGAATGAGRAVGALLRQGRRRRLPPASGLGSRQVV
jgi:DNA-binding transcriptional ArsR family regulator